MSEQTQGQAKDEGEAILAGNSSWSVAYRQFKKDKIAVAAFFALVGVAMLALFSPLIANSKPILVSYQGRLYMPAFKDYLDPNIPIPFGIPSWLKRNVPSVFSPRYPTIKRPAWQSVPEWLDIRQEIDKSGEGWYWLPPIPYYYSDESSGIKLKPGYSMARLELPEQGDRSAEVLEFVPGRPAEQELAKLRSRLPKGATTRARLEFDAQRKSWDIVDPTELTVTAPEGWEDFELFGWDGFQQSLASPDERHAAGVACSWQWRSDYLPEGASLEATERSLERALEFWRDEVPVPEDWSFTSTHWTTVGTFPAIRAHAQPTDAEQKRLIGLEATGKTAYLIFAPDRVFTVLVFAPVKRREISGAYMGPLHDELAERVLASLAFQAPSGTTKVAGEVVKGRRTLEAGQVLDLSGARAEFVQLEPFLLGSDSSGRCVLSRLTHGAVIAGSVGVVAVSIYVVIGVFLGALAGYFRGWVDLLISRLIEVVICFPVLFLIIMIVGFWGEGSGSIYMIMIALGLLRWTGVARLVRGEILKTMSEEYVSAAKSLGLPTSRIIFRHILPNSISPVFVSASFGVAGAILVETSLSFLGFGVAPPTASWGEILRQGKEFVNEDVPHLIWAPGFCIFFTVTLFNLVGEGLRDALDPKLRK